MNKIKWDGYKDSKTGRTVVQVTLGAHKLSVSLSSRHAIDMDTAAFQRLLKRLQEAIELYDET